jgi:hypothetical protein
LFDLIAFSIIHHYLLFHYYLPIPPLFFKKIPKEGLKDPQKGTKRSPERSNWADEDSKKEQPVILFGA